MGAVLAVGVLKCGRDLVKNLNHSQGAGASRKPQNPPADGLTDAAGGEPWQYQPPPRPGS
ncbi:MAG TPA: hypothetical protein VG013_18625 [Gemmataceae bacterium]|nr:hypothetical protein [Gemmataceae bacterium]